MVEFASTGLFIAFGFHICSLIMISFTKYVLFSIILLNIIFGTKAIFILIQPIVAVSLHLVGQYYASNLDIFVRFQ